MRLRLSFTRKIETDIVLKTTLKLRCFENGFKSGAFSKRYGFVGRENGETASI